MKNHCSIINPIEFFQLYFSAPLVRKLIATYRSRYNRLEENVDNEETNGIVEEPQHVET